jgi:hypothetical protein
MLTKTALKERGWTESLIKSFLPDPDLEKRNPMYARAAPMKLYFLWRIEGLEGTALWQEKRESARKRSESLLRAAAIRQEHLLREVKSQTVNLPRLSRRQLVQRACEHYNRLALERDKPFWATPSSEKAFLARICVNFLRHELSNYERQLEEVYGKVGAIAARSEIRNKVYSAIATGYPDLAKECERQVQSRLGNSLGTPPGIGIPSSRSLEPPFGPS